MYSPAYGKQEGLPPLAAGRTNRLAFFRIIFLFILSVLISLASNGQSINISAKNTAPEKLFREVEKQTSYRFVFSQSDMKNARPVTMQLKNGTIEEFLSLCFASQPLGYRISDKMIVIHAKPEESQPEKTVATVFRYMGQVVNERGEPVADASIETNAGVSAKTDDQGRFDMANLPAGVSALVSSVGYEPREMALQTPSTRIVLQTKVTQLDETMVIAYGTTTRRLSTGSVSKVSSEEISRQPVMDPLATLQGRVPGMVVTQTSGVTGAAFNVEIRGRSSLDLNLSRNDPLIIIDGVPFQPGILPSTQLVSAANEPHNIFSGGLSPLNSINPADIESIEVLKDADATAIYGSRGANGVILISTRKGKAGKTIFSLNYNHGWSHVTRTLDMMNTQEYLAMRREAFRNDNIVPTSVNAPDLFLVDTTKYTDFKKMFIGNTAQSTSVQFSMSGGNQQTQFLLGGGYNRQSNVFSPNLFDDRASVNFNINHHTQDRRFSILFSGYFSSDKNRLIQTDLTEYMMLPPHLQLLDSAGKPAWTAGGVDFLTFASTNPIAEFFRKYTAHTTTTSGNMNLTYRLLKELVLRGSFGYNIVLVDEEALIPKASVPPSASPTGSSSFAGNRSVSWTAEPQLEYKREWLGGKLTLLAGGTWMDNSFESNQVNGNNYTSDLLLSSIAAAGSITARSTYSKYRYTAVFGRINYNWGDRYVINFSGRRDGSSRFAEDKRFASFGAIGAAWIFSATKLVREQFPFLSFGKLRASYGTTGNDQIGNYKYLALWNSTTDTYQGVPGLTPANLFNPEYEWELTQKAEASLELGFLKDRLLFSASVYRNRSSNQLISYNLPNQTGFSSIVRNLPALVQNTGLELTLNAGLMKTKTWEWNSSVNMTLPRNKLISFPGLAASSYATQFQEGQPLSAVSVYHYLGADPSQGVYSFDDVNKDGKLGIQDRSFRQLRTVKFYGGWQNDLQFKNFGLSFFFEFRKQSGPTYFNQLSTYSPGSIFRNQPLLVRDRWQKPGDISFIPKYSTGVSQSNSLLLSSDAIYGDASFIRFKNLSLMYELPSRILNKLQISQVQLYVQGQNLFVITKYAGTDPEIQNPWRLPPLRTAVAGIKIIF